MGAGSSAIHVLSHNLPNLPSFWYGHAIFAKAMRHRCRSREQDHRRANTATTRGQLDLPMMNRAFLEFAASQRGFEVAQNLACNVIHSLHFFCMLFNSSPIAEVWSPEKGNWIYRIYRRTQFYRGYIPTTTHTFSNIVCIRFKSWIVRLRCLWYIVVLGIPLQVFLPKSAARNLILMYVVQPEVRKVLMMKS